MDCNLESAAVSGVVDYADEAADADIAENVSNEEFLAQSQPAACLQPQELCEMTPAVPQLVSSSTELLHFSSSAVLSSDISMDITTSQASEIRRGCGCLAATAPDPETNSKVSLMYLCRWDRILLNFPPGLGLPLGQVPGRHHAGPYLCVRGRGPGCGEPQRESDDQGLESQFKTQLVGFE